MQLPLFEPKSDWRAPTELPNLEDADVIGFDVETRDDHLKSRGPGGVRRDGYVVGVSLSTGARSWYLPLRHPDGGNLDVGLVSRYLQHELGRDHQSKVGAHALYDLEWLRCDLNVSVAGRVYDVLHAEPLLDEHRRRYNLHDLAQRYTGHGKEYEGLLRAVLEYVGERALESPRAHLWKLPARHVGAYAEADAALPIQILEAQRRRLAEEDLEEVFELESSLIPVVLDMRLRGVRVDLACAERTLRTLTDKQRESQVLLDRAAGSPVNVWASATISRVFDAAGLSYPRTARGAPSFESDWLETHPAPLAQAVAAVRRLDRLASFVRSHCLEHEVGGRVHCQFHQLPSDEGGTVTGRFSSSNPNLQQIPVRDPELGPLLRTLYVPEEGQRWLSADYASQEPRLMAHYALTLGLPGSEDLSLVDLHQLVADRTGLDRGVAKVVNLAVAYGAGVRRVAQQLNVSEDQARLILEKVNGAAPFVRRLRDRVAARAESVGYIRTLSGRRSRFDLWEPQSFEDRRPPLPRDQALERYGRGIRRAYLHKALNRLIQGSAADQTKYAMLRCHEVGFQPTLQVHDELAFSVPSLESAREIGRIMETAVSLRVPSRVELKLGPSWGETRAVL